MAAEDPSEHGSLLPPPSRTELRNKLLNVMAGRASREEVADWAKQWLNDDFPEVTDEVAWTALTDLMGVDLRVNATDYLHGEQDMHSWLDAIESSGL